MAANDPVTITRGQIQYLAEMILDAANKHTEQRMVTVVDDTSDDYHIPTAKAVNNKIGGIQHFIVLTVASGNPADAEDIEPNADTMYMVRTAPDSEQYVPYIWTEQTGFISMPGVPETAGEETTTPTAMTNDEIADAVLAAADAVVVIPTETTDPDPSDPGSGDEPGTGDNPTQDPTPDPDPTTDPTTDGESGSGTDDSGD